MYLLLIGIMGVALKYLGIEPVAGLNWWLVLLPFALAVGWWAWADASGYTKRKQIKEMDERKQKRIGKHRSAMGQPPRTRL